MIASGMFNYPDGFLRALKCKDDFYAAFVANQDEHLRKEDPTRI